MLFAAQFYPKFTIKFPLGITGLCSFLNILHTENMINQKLKVAARSIGDVFLTIGKLAIVDTTTILLGLIVFVKR